MFTPTRIQKIRDYKKNEAEYEDHKRWRKAMRESYHDASIIRVSGAWVAFCNCGWDTERYEWQDALIDKVNHRLGK